MFLLNSWCYSGFGYADLENRVPCSPETVLRIASISKPLTSAAAARLCEEGKLNLDVPVQKYVPEFPQKQFDGQDVSHLEQNDTVFSLSVIILCRSFTCSAHMHIVCAVLSGRNNPSYDSVPPEWYPSL